MKMANRLRKIEKVHKRKLTNCKEIHNEFGLASVEIWEQLRFGINQLWFASTKVLDKKGDKKGDKKSDKINEI